MSQDLEVVSVNVSKCKGTVKQPVECITIDSHGVVGDAHAGPWHRQISLLGQASIDRFATTLGRAILPGEFGENITVCGLEPKAWPFSIVSASVQSNWKSRRSARSVTARAAPSFNRSADA